MVEENIMSYETYKTSISVTKNSKGYNFDVKVRDMDDAEAVKRAKKLMNDLETEFPNKEE